MNKFLTFLLLIMMLFTAAEAQKKETVAVNWRVAGELPATAGQKKSLGLAGAFAGANNNVLLVGGGSNFPDSMPWLGGKKKYYDDVFVYRKNADDSLVLLNSFKLPFALAYAASCSTAQGVVVAGGEAEEGLSKKVLLLQWQTDSNIHIENLPDLPFAVTNASILVRQQRIYLAGGETVSAVSDQFLSLDLENVARGWKALPSLPKPVSHAVMVVQSNGREECIYLLGGRKKNAGGTSDLYASNWQFDFTKAKWTMKESLPYALSAGTGAAVADHAIVLFGGDSGETFHRTEELIAAIGKETNAEKKGALNEEKIKTQSTHPGFSRQVLLYDTEKNKWKAVGNIPFDTPVTATAVKWNNEVFIPGGEIRAGVRTPLILSAKIHF